MSEIEDEIRASLVADLSLSRIFYHDAEYEADDLLKRLKQEWAHELAERIRNEDAALGGETYQHGWSFQDAADLIDPKVEK